MTVVVNALSLRPGVTDGASTYALNLLAHLPAAAPELHFTVLVRPGESRVPAATNVEVREVALRGGAAARLVAERAWLARELRRCGASLLLSPNESVPARSPCPLVVIAQNVVYHCDPPAVRFTGATPALRLRTAAQYGYYRREMRRAYRSAAAVVATSAFAADLLGERAGLERGRTTVALSGADSFLLGPAGGSSAADGPAPAAAQRLLVVAALAPHKRLLETLAVFAELQARRPALRLEIAGADWRGYRGVVEREIARLGLGGAVALLGPVAASEVARLYASSLALLHLSTCESFGLPLVEAMRLGLPAVAAQQGPSPEVAAGAALLVDPADPAGAAARIGPVLDDPAALAGLAARGRARAAELSWQRTAEGVAAVVRRVLDDGSGRRGAAGPRRGAD